MAPKKGKGKKKGGAPKPDSGWQKTLGNFKWERPLEALPDPAIAPAWVETRANLLAACNLISIIWNTRVDEPFIAELFSIPRPNLEKLELRGSKFLTKYVMSPFTVAPNLKELDLSCCAALDYVFIESNSLEKISLARCVNLKKAHIVVRGLKELDLRECSELVDLMFWSDNVTVLNSPRREKDRLELYCPELKNFDRPPIKLVKPVVITPPALRELIAHDKLTAKYEAEQNRVIEPGFTGHVDVPKTPYLGFNSYLQA